VVGSQWSAVGEESLMKINKEIVSKQKKIEKEQPTTDH
jgi:hypothetical protein